MEKEITKQTNTKRKKVTNTTNNNEETTSLTNKKHTSSTKQKNNFPVKIFALGGLGEVGKNLYCLEYKDTIILIDCGVLFPDDTMIGVNYLIPNYTYLQQNQDKIKALIITHGHEDHIGGIPFLFQVINPLPIIYSPKFAASLIRHKLKDIKISNAPIIEYNENSIYHIGDFTISFFVVTHSIPDAFGICIDTPQGRIVDTGDFKVDLNPVESTFNLPKLVQLGNEGIDLLMADSTNAEKEGYTPSESTVQDSMQEIFEQTKGRIIISTFASNISRIIQIIKQARNFDRKICVVGRSMESNLRVAREQGLIKIKDTDLVSVEKVNNIEKNKICILCTGSQGEKLAALSRFVNGTHKNINITPGDTIIFSSSPIPGNTQGIERLTNEMIKHNAFVFQNDEQYTLHASGHPCKQELRLIQKLARPKYFMPVHGDRRMLQIHAKLAQDLGLKEENTFVCSNGDVLNLLDHKVTRSNETIVNGSLPLESTEIHILQTALLTDRHIIANNGVVIITIVLDPSKNKLITKPTFVSKGFIEISKPSFKQMLTEGIYSSLNTMYKSNSKVTFSLIKDTITKEAKNIIKQETDKEPMVIPLIMSIPDYIQANGDTSEN